MRACKLPYGQLTSVLLWIAIAGVVSGAAPRVTAAAKSDFAGEPQFQRPLTVRVAGMPLDQLLPRISRELGVSLRPGTPDVGDIRVALFAEEIPAHRSLDALTEMLNFTRERGFTWEKTKRGERTEYRLFLDARARAEGTQRIRKLHEETDARFLKQLAELRQDPELKKRGEDATPLPGFGRAPYLLTTLSDAQLNRLLKDGVFVLRYSEATPAQQQTLAKMGPDLLQGVDRLLQQAPELVPLYSNLHPPDFTVVFELERNSANLKVMGELKCGPGKGGVRYEVFPAPPGSGARSARSGSPGVGGAKTTPAGKPGAVPPDQNTQRIELRPRSWSMADVLSDYARRTRQLLASDCYSMSWQPLRGLGPATPEQIQRRIDALWGVQWERREGFTLARSRVYYARQAREIPQRLIDGWISTMEADPRLKLEMLGQMAALTNPQIEALEECAELQQAAPSIHALAMHLRAPLQFYQLLPQALRNRVRGPGVHVSVDDMTPVMRYQFFRWMLNRNPHIPERDYASGYMRLQHHPDSRLELTWKAGETTGAQTYWLDLTRDWVQGQPRELRAPTAETLVGKTAPEALVQTLDGRSQPLFPEKGGRTLVYFRDPWLVPYVGSEADDADLRALDALVARRPELARRIQMVCPYATSEELKAWAAERKLKLSCFADPDGAAARAYGAQREPRAIWVDEANRVTRVVSGHDNLSRVDWETAWR